MKFSKKGYLRNSPDVNKTQNIIQGGNITMKGVDFKVHGVDNNGYAKVMTPGYDYNFPNAKYVTETPIKNKEMNGPFKMKPGQGKKQAFKEIPFSMKSPFYVTGDPVEKKVDTEVTKSRVTQPSGQTGTLVTIKDKYKTPGGEVTRTTEGDKAYAAKTPEQRKAQDDAYLAKKRSETRQRFIADPISIETQGITTMPSAEIKTSTDISKDIFHREFDKPESEANYKLRQDLYKRKYKGVDSSTMTNKEKLARNEYSKLRKTAEQRKSASEAQKKQIAKQKLKKALTIDLSKKGAKKGSMRGKAGCPTGNC